MGITNLKVELELTLYNGLLEYIDLECLDIDDYVKKYNKDIRPRLGTDCAYILGGLVDADYDGYINCDYERGDGVNYWYEDDKYGTFGKVIRFDNAANLYVHISRRRRSEFEIRYTQSAIRELISKDGLASWAIANNKVITF